MDPVSDFDKLKFYRSAETDLSHDREHLHSLAFSRFAPRVFIVFWIAAALFCTSRAWLGL